ncbi:MAG: helicase-related protein [Candidatus Woesearchaeota archaeon]|nr:helicase-related protein [Candidatus Woesearchaeota archaeon]
MDIPSPTDSGAINLALHTLGMNKQALVFVNTKRSAEKTAEDLAKQIKNLGAEQIASLTVLSDELLNVLSTPTRQCQRLATCAKKGIAFHHSGLTPKQRELVEDNFRGGAIKIICATPTLAAGIDVPSFRTILRDLKRYGHRGLDWIPVLEYEQMAGRSGRPAYDTYGEAIAVADSEKEAEHIYERYICGVPEEIHSKLAVEPVLRMYVLALVASEFVSTEEELLAFFSETFWAAHYQDMAHFEKIINRVLGVLETYGFIAASMRAHERGDFVSAAELEQGRSGRISATPIGKRVAELYLDPYTAHQVLIGMERSGTKATNEFSYLHLIAAQLELRPQLTVRKKEYESMQQKLCEYEGLLIHLEPSLYDPEYDDFLNSFKTALFFDEWMNEKDEEFLLETFDVRPGEIRVKLDRADWLLYAASELARMNKNFDELKKIQKARVRLKYGVKEELLPLLKLAGIGRVRARKLFNNKICAIEDVKKADVLVLSQLIGKSIAAAIKKQVGQDGEKVVVRENKRKGQINLADY